MQLDSRQTEQSNAKQGSNPTTSDTRSGLPVTDVRHAVAPPAESGSPGHRNVDGVNEVGRFRDLLRVASDGRNGDLKDIDIARIGRTDVSKGIDVSGIARDILNGKVVFVDGQAVSIKALDGKFADVKGIDGVRPEGSKGEGIRAIEGSRLGPEGKIVGFDIKSGEPIRIDSKNGTKDGAVLGSGIDENGRRVDAAGRRIDQSAIAGNGGKGAETSGHVDHVFNIGAEFETEDEEESRELLENWDEFISGEYLEAPQIFPFTLFGDVKKLDDLAKDSAKEQPKRLSTRRIRYTVQRGDTLESIARNQCGDRRFASTVLNINRATIHVAVIEGKNVPIIKVGQVLWLPSEAERDMYSKVVFSSQTKRNGSYPNGTPSDSPSGNSSSSQSGSNSGGGDSYGYGYGYGSGTSSASGAHAIPAVEGPPVLVAARTSAEPSFTSELLQPAPIVVGGEATVPSLEIAPLVPAPKIENEPTTVKLQDGPRPEMINNEIQTSAQGAKSLFEKFSEIAHAGERKTARIEDMDGPVARRVLDRLNQAAASRKQQEYLMPSGDTTENHAAPAPRVVAPTPRGPNSTERNAVVDTLAECCRTVTVVADPASANHDFTTSLQILVDGSWINVSTYEFKNGHGYRHSFYSSQNHRPFTMDLPVFIIKEMAREDFRRNWSEYCREFLIRRQAPELPTEQC